VHLKEPSELRRAEKSWSIRFGTCRNAGRTRVLVPSDAMTVYRCRFGPIMPQRPEQLRKYIASDTGVQHGAYSRNTSMNSNNIV
jgi:hypothetical protein